jgi:hypothetical protein
MAGLLFALLFTSCTPPSSAFLSLRQSFCDAVKKAKDWIRSNLDRIQVSAASAYVMETPSIQGVKLTTVKRGEVLQKVGKQDVWLKVLLKTQLGWILTKFVQPVQ